MEAQDDGSCGSVPVSPGPLPHGTGDGSLHWGPKEM